LTFGMAFGFALSRARASDYDTIVAMFRGRDLHLAGVMMVAIATGALGLALVRRRTRRSLTGEPLELHAKPFRSAVVPAGLVFGAGWALTGTCPGTALVQLGELKTYAVFTLLGILAGTYGYARASTRSTDRSTPLAGSRSSAPSTSGASG
jgi:uncharacterized membrane protein YedE/YeeE